MFTLTIDVGADAFTNEPEATRDTIANLLHRVAVEVAHVRQRSGERVTRGEFTVGTLTARFDCDGPDLLMLLKRQHAAVGHLNAPKIKTRVLASGALADMGDEVADAIAKVEARR